MQVVICIKIKEVGLYPQEQYSWAGAICGGRGVDGESTKAERSAVGRAVCKIVADKAAKTQIFPTQTTASRCPGPWILLKLGAYFQASL
jgi:hypothetical protein